MGCMLEGGGHGGVLDVGSVTMIYTGPQFMTPSFSPVHPRLFSSFHPRPFTWWYSSLTKGLKRQEDRPSPRDHLQGALEPMWVAAELAHRHLRTGLRCMHVCPSLADRRRQAPFRIGEILGAMSEMTARYGVASGRRANQAATDGRLPRRKTGLCLSTAPAASYAASPSSALLTSTHLDGLIGSVRGHKEHVSQRVCLTTIRCRRPWRQNRIFGDKGTKAGEKRQEGGLRNISSRNGKTLLISRELRPRPRCQGTGYWVTYPARQTEANCDGGGSIVRAQPKGRR
ncbi:hypothetical protein QBC34DRAFT_399678 [Podospora aff. communis PSN243]|uniref:Uncharacterized protein n=1 Tax=Podospora aff. communis PSN243 TaxID=3040156 RepID=A0AAV9GZ32_9PEZI|nr:hypothetical protein QBC34DRAFT_399678 [Podospora aff. communis PSN243]